MLVFLKAEDDEETIQNFGVSIKSLGISIILSLTHTILECLFLYMESQATKTSFINYTIVCFNGRFGWVPYNDYLIKTSQIMLQNLNKKRSKD